MEAILLVGGKGTRLRPLTVNTPKPMLPVGGVPFTAHQLALARAAGIERILLATSYKAEVFTDWLGDGSRLGLEIEYVIEGVPLGTGGAIRNVADRLTSKPDDPVVVLNGDVLSGHDLVAQIDRHREANADVTLHLTVVDDARAFGCVPTDDTSRVSAFMEKMPHPVTNQINAGCYVFRRSVIDTIPVGEVVSVERQTFPELLAAAPTCSASWIRAYWLDLGTPQAVVRASRDLVLGRVSSPALPGAIARSTRPPWSPAACRGPTVGGGSVIGRDAEVQEGAVVEGSILQDGAVVGARCRRPRLRRRSGRAHRAT